MTQIGAEVGPQPGGGAGGVTDHDLLAHLDYPSAAHTGFAPTVHNHAPGNIVPQGAGSGLDADKLDGQHAAAFAAAIHGHAPGDIAPQGPGSGLDSDTVDGAHAAAFAAAVHGHAPGDIAPQGALSTLDADLLDGQHAAAFAAAAHNHAPADIVPQGALSTLDADLLDGQHAAAFAPIVHTHPQSDLVADIEGRAARFLVTNPYVAKAHSYKGQIHCHSTNSDGDTPPAGVVNAYKAAGYDFVSITDHNFLTPDPGVGGILYILGVEQNIAGCQYHMTQLWAVAAKSLDGQPLIDSVLLDAATIGLCHPNWPGFPLTFTLMDRLDGLYSIDVYNQTVTPNSNGEDKWDLLLTEGVKILGVAVDDCHFTGGIDFDKAWIIVFADSLTSADVKDSFKKGNFYSTTGPTLTISQAGNTLSATTGALSTIEWIGKAGTVLRTTPNVTTDSYTIAGDEMYVRVRITRNADAKQAWSNPIWVDIITTQDLKGGGQVRGNLYLNKTGAAYGAALYADNKPIMLLENLLATRNYYVRTNGNDANDGLANDAAHAWLTVQHAVDYVIANINLNGQMVVINLADGTYTGVINIPANPAGNGTVYIKGNSVTPANVILDSNNAASTVYVTLANKWDFRYLKIQASGGSGTRIGIIVYLFAYLSLYQVSFGACPGADLYVSRKSMCVIQTGSTINITGDTSYLYYAELDSTIYILSASQVITMPRNIGTGAYANTGSIIKWLTSTWTNTFVGKRYDGQMLSAISTGTGNVNWIPGTIAGTLVTGSQYD